MKRLQESRHRWRSVRRFLFAAVIAATCVGDALAQFVMRQYTVAGSGVSASHSACYSLSNTSGEAVTGPVGAGQYQLNSGFWGARPSVLHDSIFNDGFEDCSP